jgi:hypothetical protein
MLIGTTLHTAASTLQWTSMGVMVETIAYASYVFLLLCQLPAVPCQQISVGISLAKSQILLPPLFAARTYPGFLVV